MKEAARWDLTIARISMSQQIHNSIYNPNHGSVYIQLTECGDEVMSYAVWWTDLLSEQFDRASLAVVPTLWLDV